MASRNIRPKTRCQRPDRNVGRDASVPTQQSTVGHRGGQQLGRRQQGCDRGLEVDTRDRPGLLYDLTRTLAANNIYIASAVIATYGAQVVDSFYVKDMFGLKLHTKSKQEALERKLRQAITEGVERARS